MSQFIESIKIENGKAFLLNLHQQRVEKTFSHFGKTSHLDLKAIFKNSKFNEKGIFKMRMVYDLEQNFEVQFIPYQFTEIEHFGLVENPHISYDFKFLDRNQLNLLKENFHSQEIIIVKNSYITDTSFSNLLFLKDETWHTPTTFLLNGVQRQNLLQHGKIKETEIHIENLKEFSHFQIINAMNEMNSSFIYPINKIVNV
ncbi:MAG: aminotransferase class IV [Flavobacteriaceae bacterium]|nr:aminotransferase class IV [Flavobacteriaceae bacterium]